MCTSDNADSFERCVPGLGLNDGSIPLHSESNRDNDLKLFPAIPLPPVTGCCSRQKV